MGACGPCLDVTPLCTALDANFTFDCSLRASLCTAHDVICASTVHRVSLTLLCSHSELNGASLPAAHARAKFSQHRAGGDMTEAVTLIK
jgi:hypothetical protein